MQPLSRLKSYLQGRQNVPFIECAAPAYRGLVRERADGLQTSLNAHQPELFAKVIRIDRRQTMPAARFQKIESVRAHRRERRRLGLSIKQQRNKVITCRTHPRILVIHDPNSILPVDQKISAVIIAMTKNSWTSSEFGGDV